MDKKNTLLGILCIVAGIAVMYKQASDFQKQSEQLEEESATQQPIQEAIENGTIASPIEFSEGKEGDNTLDLLAKPVDHSIEPTFSKVDEEIITLSNEFIEVEFTNLGGAIRTVSFLQTKRGARDDYVFNSDGLLPALSLSLEGQEGNLREFAFPFKVEQQTDDSVTFAFNSEDGMSLRRTYTLAQSDSEQDPYSILHSTTFKNQSEIPLAFSKIFLNLGTARPVSERQQQSFLNVGYFNGKDAKFIAIDKLTGGGPLSFLGMGAPPTDVIERSVRSQWVSVKNQFFTAILTSETEGRNLFIYKVDTPATDGDGFSRPGISASVGYETGVVSPSSTNTLQFDYYVGPKEFKRLQSMNNGQDAVMQFGFLGLISKLLLSFMYGIHSIVPNWGWSIVIMTVCIKLLFWPLSAKASRSQKRMSKIQEPMKELKEKYKDNPQKFQQETIKLFKKYQVNPVAGCLPMLIQMPIFVGLFYMLRSAAELRHEPFLWVNDLSMPDTIAYIYGFPVNVLPIIMGLTMFFQMSMVPVSPTADPMQQKVFKFLPFVFLIFLYNFSAGLVLYWTVQNILTILQQKMINRLPDEELEPVTQSVTSSQKNRVGAKLRKKN